MNVLSPLYNENVIYIVHIRCSLVDCIELIVIKYKRTKLTQFLTENWRKMVSKEKGFSLLITAA